MSLLFFFVIITLHTAHAELAIQSFSTSPQTVQPGEEVRIQLHLENVGNDDLMNVLVSLDLSELPFAPVDSSSEKVIEEIQEGDEETISFTLVTLSRAEPMVYKIPVIIYYNNTEKSSLISVEVTADPELDILLGSSDLFLVNEQGKITVKFVNNGLTEIKFLQVTLLESPDYEILSPSSVYIGSIDVEDFDSEEFSILPQRSNPELHFRLEYRDANNEAFQEEKKLEARVYTEDEAKTLGLVKERYTGTMILVVIVMILAGITFYKRKKRKHYVA